MILGDRDLKYYIEKKRIVIEPFDDEIIRENGVDLRLGNQVARLRRTSITLDSSNPPEDLSPYYAIEESDEILIAPGEVVLLTSLEYLKLPEDIMAFVELRSSFARLGLLMPPTIIDAGFEGNVTLEVHGSAFPVLLRRGQRFAHIIFARTLSPVESPYRGRYQGQRGVTLPKLYSKGGQKN